MKKLVIDVATGERQEVDMSADEIAELEAIEAQSLADEQARADLKASAIAKLEALGLTVDEVSAAFGLEA